MTKECEDKLAEVLNPFLAAAGSFRKALAGGTPTGELRKAYEERKVTVVEFLACQRTNSGLIGAISTVPDWVGPIGGKIAEIDAGLREAQRK